MLFGKKSSLAPEERRERVQAIERLINADKDDEDFRLTQALEKGTGPRRDWPWPAFTPWAKMCGRTTPPLPCAPQKKGFFGLSG